MTARTSSISEADPEDFDFDKIMEGADWFHWSGITPAISDKAAELTRLACEAAKRHGVTVSVDLNFRKNFGLLKSPVNHASAYEVCRCMYRQ